MKDNIQFFLKEAGQSACYTLCLIRVAEKYLKKDLDVVKAMQIGIEKRCIDYKDGDTEYEDNFYVRCPETFLFYLTGVHWEVRKETYPYNARKGEYVINRYERQRTGCISAHFEMDDFHPIANSLTVKYGRIASVRVLRAVK